MYFVFTWIFARPVRRQATRVKQWKAHFRCVASMPQHDKSKEILAQGATPKAPKTLL
jgi:hypothetical protein